MSDLRSALPLLLSADWSHSLSKWRDLWVKDAHQNFMYDTEYYQFCGHVCTSIFFALSRSKNLSEVVHWWTGSLLSSSTLTLYHTVFHLGNKPIFFTLITNDAYTMAINVVKKGCLRINKKLNFLLFYGHVMSLCSKIKLVLWIQRVWFYHVYLFRFFFSLLYYILLNIYLLSI